MTNTSDTPPGADDETFVERPEPRRLECPARRPDEVVVENPDT